MSMSYAGHILLNDRSVIQHGGCVVSSCADEFYPAFVRLMVRFPSGKRGQKGMVDVDHGWRGAKELRRQHLHVTRHDYQIHRELVQQAELTCLGLRLGRGGDGKMVKGYSIAACCIGEIGVIRYHDYEIRRVVSGLPTEKQIVETVVEFGYKQSNPGSTCAIRHLRSHAE